MKVGRNDPCPCGSGKKYKKCCLDTDEKAVAAARSEMALPPVLPSLPDAAPRRAAPNHPLAPEPPPDPEIEAINARWEEFENRDFEGRIELFHRTLGDEALMDEEMAFEMLDEIHSAAVELSERDRFASLVTALRERLPEIYEHDAPFYLLRMITDKAAEGRYDALPALAAQLAATADSDIDLFNNALDLLAYHGQMDTLVEMMRAAWPRVRQSTNTVPWGIDEFAERAVRYEIYHYLERAAAPDPADPELGRRIGAYIDVDSAADADRWARLFIGPLTGAARQDWTPDAFAPPRRRTPRDPKHGKAGETEGEESENLLALRSEFVGFLRSSKAIPYAKGDLAGWMLHDYLLDRHNGKLEPRVGMLEATLYPRKNPRPERRDPVPFLCPDAITLDRYLESLLGLLTPQYYKAVTMFELTPDWLRFLESRHLIDTSLREKTLREIRERLHHEILQLSHVDNQDPTVDKALERWPGDPCSDG